MKCNKCNKEKKELYDYYDNGFDESFEICEDCLKKIGENKNEVG